MVTTIFCQYAQGDRDLILFTSFELHVFSSRYRHFCPGRVYSPWAFYVITQCLFMLKKNKTEKDYNSSCRGHNIVIRIRHSHKSSFYWKGRKKRRRTDKTTNHAIGSTRNDPIQTHFNEYIQSRMSYTFDLKNRICFFLLGVFVSIQNV